MEIHHGELLKQAISDSPKKVKDVAGAMKISRQRLYLLYDKAELKPEVRQAAAAALGRTESEVFDVNVSMTATTPGDDLRRKKAFEERPLKGILFVPAEAQNGYSYSLSHDAVFTIDELQRIKIPGLPYDGDEYRAFQQAGDSNEYWNPETNQWEGIRNGDYVIGQAVPQEDWKENLRTHLLYTIVMPGNIWTKVILRDGDKNTVVLHALNPDVPQRRLKLSAISEIWLVVDRLDRQIPRANREVKITV